MQDIRLRVGSAALLSFAAFTSITGAFAVFLWWLVFSRPRHVLKAWRLVIPAIILVFFFSLVLEFTKGGGISYGFRMIVLILIGTWLFSRYREGEFLGFCTWLLGKKSGFDLGMVAEMGMLSMEQLGADLARIRLVHRLKGTRWGIRSIVPAVTILIHGALRRADEIAEIMAVRGYRHGGSYCPVFETSLKDGIAVCAALCMGIIAILPVSEFFILYH